MHRCSVPVRALAATTFAVGAVLGAAPAHAAGPTHTVESVDFTIPVHPPTSNACGFPVSLHVSGTWNVVTFTDGNGAVTKEIRNYRFRGELSANGVTIHGVSRGPEITTFHPDGSFTMAVHGVVNRRVPGAGTVTLFSGLTITTVDGETEVVEFTSGPADEDVSGVCAAFTA